MKYSFIFITLIGFIACDRATDGCKKDTDCREGRICISGDCVFARAKKKPEKKSPDPVSDDKNKNTPSNHIVTPITPPVTPDPLKQILGNLNLNLDLDTPGGRVKLQMKGMKNGVPIIEMCQNGKCSEVDMSDPNAMVDIMTKFMGSGNPTDLMSQFLKNFNNLSNINPRYPGSNTRRPVLPPVRPGSPIISPSHPVPGGPYRSVKDILKDKNRAAGREAILSSVRPVNISLPDSVDFKTNDGIRIETKAAQAVRSELRKLAKISGTVIIRIKIQKVSGTLIRGELTEIDFNN